MNAGFGVSRRFGSLVFSAVALFLVATSAAWSSPVPCMDGSEELSIDNEKVVEMKKVAPLGRVFRAYVQGKVTRIFPSRTNSRGTVHEHFEIQIGDSPKDVLEVVYSEDFGDMPSPQPGAEVEACGDFINAYGKNNGYEPSPSGAIIHWVHKSNTSSHDDGFVVMGDELYGHGEDKRPRMENGEEKRQKPGRRPRHRR